MATHLHDNWEQSPVTSRLSGNPVAGIDIATGLFLAGARWYDSSVGRFLSTTGRGDGGGYAYVPTNPMDLANGYVNTPAPRGGSDGGDPGYSHYFFNGWAAQGFHAVGNGIRSVGDLLASPFDLLADWSDSPGDSAVLGFASGAIQIPFDIVGSVVDIPGLIGGATSRFDAYARAGGPGTYNIMLGLSGASGVASFAEGIAGIDITTGEVLDGDERFDRTVMGAGAIGGIFLSGVGSGASAAARLRPLAASGSPLAQILTSDITVPSLNNLFKGLGTQSGLSRSEILAQRLEANAELVLQRLEAAAGDGAHFYSRHGAQTTLESQYWRAKIGLTPDGVFKSPVDSSRFLSHRAQLNAVQAAEEIFERTGKTKFTFDAGYTVGEGFKKGGAQGAIIRTSNVQAIFEKGKLKTLYPLLSEIK